MIVACAVQFLLSAINAFGYVGRDSSALQSARRSTSSNLLVAGGAIQAG
jgi:hypothetical protein